MSFNFVSQSIQAIDHESPLCGTSPKTVPYLEKYSSRLSDRDFFCNPHIYVQSENNKILKNVSLDVSHSNFETSQVPVSLSYNNVQALRNYSKNVCLGFPNPSQILLRSWCLVVIRFLKITANQTIQRIISDRLRSVR